MNRQQGKGEPMLITTQDYLSGYDITETLGIVRGNTIRTRHVGKDVSISYPAVIGNEISEYTELISEARKQAFDRMVTEAEDKGANAILSTRFATSTVLQGAAELLAYGTAVKIERQM